MAPDSDRASVRPASAFGWTSAAWGVLVLLAELPSLTHLPEPHPAWSIVCLTLEAAIHALCWAAVLQLIVSVAAVRRPGLRRPLAAAVGAVLVVFSAFDATLYGVIGLHIGPRTFGNLLEHNALTTLGVSAGDLLKAGAVLAFAVACGTLATRGAVLPRPALRFAVGLIALDATLSLVDGVTHYFGVQPLVGLRVAMPLAWRPNLDAALMGALGTPPKAIDDDFQFPNPALLPAEYRQLASSAWPDQARTTPDILIIVVESLRSDALDAMPRLEAFMKRGIIAEHHVSSGNCSFLANFSLLTGLDSSYWAVRDTWRAPQGLGALISLGYRVQMTNSAAMDFNMAERTLPPGHRELVPTPDASPEMRDVHTAEWLRGWLAEPQTSPRAAIVFFDGSHWPYHIVGEPTPPVRLGDSWFVRDKADEFRSRYRRSLAAIDGLLGPALESLEASGRISNTAVVVVGDHGEAFREHGVFGHGSRLDDEQLRAPMGLRLPGREPGTISRVTTHSDVLPTLLAFIGAAPLTAGPAVGIDVFSAGERASPPIVGSCAIAMPDGYAALVGERKVLFQLDANGTHYVGTLGPGDVPEERTEDDAEISAALRAVTRAHQDLSGKAMTPERGLTPSTARGP
jgi:hypothetical protein